MRLPKLNASPISALTYPCQRASPEGQTGGRIVNVLMGGYQGQRQGKLSVLCKLNRDAACKEPALRERVGPVEIYWYINWYMSGLNVENRQNFEYHSPIN